MSTATATTMKNVKFTPTQIKFLDEYFTGKAKDLLDKLISNDEGYDEDEMRDLIAERFNTLEFKRMKESDMSSDDSSSSTDKGKGKTGKSGKGKSKASKGSNDDGKPKIKKTDGFKLFMWGENKDGEVSKLKATDNFKEQVNSEGIESKKVHPFAVKLASAKWSDMSDDQKKAYHDRATEINDANAQANTHDNNGSD